VRSSATSGMAASWGTSPHLAADFRASGHALSALARVAGRALAGADAAVERVVLQVHTDPDARGWTTGLTRRTATTAFLDRDAPPVACLLLEAALVDWQADSLGTESLTARAGGRWRRGRPRVSATLVLLPSAAPPGLGLVSREWVRERCHQAACHSGQEAAARGAGEERAHESIEGLTIHPVLLEDLDSVGSNADSGGDAGSGSPHRGVATSC
jgi:hypothetical protein